MTLRKFSKLFFLFYLVFAMNFFTTLRAKSKKTIALAIIEFQTKGNKKSSQSIAKDIYEIVLKNLITSKKLRLLDRSKLAQVLREKALTQSGLINEKMVKQAAGLLPADYIVNGEVTFKKDIVHLTVKIFSALTGELKTVEFASANQFDQPFVLADIISAKILKKLTGEKFRPLVHKYKRRSPFTIETKVARGKDSFLYIKLKVAGQEDRGKRLPINLAIVIDRSSSMSEGGKMNYTKKAVHFIIDQMKKSDLISLIAFNSSKEVILPPTAGNKRNLAHHRVKKILTQFNTNLSAGLIEGYRQIALNRKRYKLNHVIVVTDGLTNLGITENEKIWEIVKKEMKKGITTSTIGLGGTYDETMLEGIANAGGGGYHYVRKPSDIPLVALAELKTILPVVVEKGYFEFKTKSGLIIKTINGKKINKNYIKKSFAPLRAEAEKKYYLRVSGSRRSLRRKDIGVAEFYYSSTGQKKLAKITKVIRNPRKVKNAEKIVMKQVKVAELMSEVMKTLKTLDLDQYKKIVNRLVKESDAIYDFAQTNRDSDLLDEYQSLKHCVNELLSLAEWGKLHPHSSMKEYDPDELQKARKEIHFQRYKMNGK